VLLPNFGQQVCQDLPVVAAPSMRARPASRPSSVVGYTGKMKMSGAGPTTPTTARAGRLCRRSSSYRVRGSSPAVPGFAECASRGVTVVGVRRSSVTGARSSSRARRRAAPAAGSGETAQDPEAPPARRCAHRGTSHAKTRSRRGWAGLSAGSWRRPRGSFRVAGSRVWSVWRAAGYRLVDARGAAGGRNGTAPRADSTSRNCVWPVKPGPSSKTRL
jgi:hypothetical protein